ncbi:hypothetical protein SDC9_134181 [bioreactor metagenome]|uniref:Uncharacterized protein n=1 Tax=bioreactor metagenome TaxID=1076179 RepID=A0A645DDH0_9ZZZZ
MQIKRKNDILCVLCDLIHIYILLPPERKATCWKIIRLHPSVLRSRTTPSKRTKARRLPTLQKRGPKREYGLSQLSSCWSPHWRSSCSCLKTQGRLCQPALYPKAVWKTVLHSMAQLKVTPPPASIRLKPGWSRQSMLKSATRLSPAISSANWTPLIWKDLLKFRRQPSATPSKRLS